MTRTMLALTGATALFVASAVSQEPRRFTLSGERVAVYNLVGEMQVRGGGSGAVTVEVRIQGPDASSLTIETGLVRGREALRVIYPGDRIVYRGHGEGYGTTLHVREDGTWGDGERGGRRVSIRGSGSGLEAHAVVLVTVPEGRDVAVFLGAGDVSVSDVSAKIDVDVASAGVTVERLRGDLNVDAGSGAVSVSGVTGQVRLDTGSGSVHVREIRGPALDLDTGSGRVSGEAITVDALSVDTGSGRLDLSGISAPRILLDTGSGGVRLELLQDVSELSIDTGSGGVILAVPADIGAEIEIETGSGGIDLDIPISATEMKRDYLRGTIGDGRGRIRIDTGSGGVRIMRAN